MKKTYRKDIWRSITVNKKRFLSILAITALGVTVLTGISAACKDLYYSSDRFYDEQNLYDIRILSTLGLTSEDVDTLNKIEGIDSAEGSYSETVYTEINQTRHSVELTMLSEKGINSPYILQGTMPAKAGDIAVTREYIEDSGKVIGDTLGIEEELEDVSEVSIEDIDDDIDDNEKETETKKENPSFSNVEYKITAIVLDPKNISNNDMAFRSAASTTDYTFFVTSQDVTSDVFTSVYMTLSQVKELDCYSQEYEEIVANVTQRIEKGIQGQREQARYDSVINEATEKIKDAETEMNDKFAEADQEFSDAWKEIEDGKKELTDGEAELTEKEKDAIRQIADARKKIADNKKKLETAEADLKQGEKEWQEGKVELEKQEKELKNGKEKLKQEKATALEEFKKAESQLAEKQSTLEQSKTELEGAVEQIKGIFGDSFPENEWNGLVTAAALKTAEQLAANPEAQVNTNEVAAATTLEQNVFSAAFLQLSIPGLDMNTLLSNSIQSGIGLGIVNGGQQVLDAGKRELEKQKKAALKQIETAEREISDGERQIEVAKKQMEAGKKELEKGKKQLADGWKKLKEGEAELNKEEKDAKKEISKAWNDLAEGQEELSDGETELNEKEVEYYQKKEDAKQKLADAYDELDDIDMTKWYVQDRTNLDSYSSLQSDMSSIESIGGAFPVLFLIVAILISLTTMTRMIEEERGLLGTYKGLGFKDGAIYAKYLIYAICACAMGGFIGDILGFIILPKFLLMVLSRLYILPDVYLQFDILYGIGGILLFMAGIGGAAMVACHSELKHTPAILMRPKAPKQGSRVFMERIPFIWNRMSFLNKVTVRNLFRYKKRFLMTVFGIMGCTALVLAGFAIKDSVSDLLPKQYEEVYQYDLMVVVKAEENEDFLEEFSKDKNVLDYINLETSLIKIINNDGKTENIQLMVIPDGKSLDGYINIRDTNHQPLSINDTGVYVTKNAADMLALKAGDSVVLRNMDLEQNGAVITAVVENYLGNNLYITEKLYRELFGKYEPNGVFAHLSKGCGDQAKYSEDLLKNDMVQSSISIQAVKRDFASNFALINAVVYMIIILAAGLAFVVLFTLSNTNISERLREIATTKVLGFYDSEVHLYINKETIILTAIGILAGLPVGRFLSSLLTTALKMPAMYFATYVQPVSYLFAAIISLGFALMVNLMTNRTLNRINMVEALKSVE